MTLIGAFFKVAGYLIKSQKLEKQCFKLEKEGKIAERNEIVNREVPKWARFMISVMGCNSSPINVQGLEKIPKDRAVVFISNHQGYCDIPLILGYSEKTTGFISKAEVLKVPILSKWMQLMECTFLQRNSPHQSVKAMARAVEKVKEGYSMVIFPEGHRSRSSEMKDFHPGSFKLAFRSGAPIVPITLDGTYHLFEEKRRPQKAELTLIFHDPIETEGLSKEELSAIPDKVHEIIKAALPKASE